MQEPGKQPVPYDGPYAAGPSSQVLTVGDSREFIPNPLFQTVPRRDKSLSALSHELIARYGTDGTVIDLDDVQVRAPTRGDARRPPPPRSRPLPRSRSPSHPDRARRGPSTRAHARGPLAGQPSARWRPGLALGARRRLMRARARPPSRSPPSPTGRSADCTT